MQAVKSGKRVAVAEKYHEVGGGCIHWATIPSKSLRHTHHSPGGVPLQSFHGPLRAGPQDRFPQPGAARRGASSISRPPCAAASTTATACACSTAGPLSWIRIPSPWRTAAGGVERFTAAHIVIASGSRPYRPPDVDFDASPGARQRHHPHLGPHARSITIYGAGVVGCEYASMFCNLGMKVNLVNARDKLLELPRRRDHRRHQVPPARPGRTSCATTRSTSASRPATTG